MTKPMSQKARAGAILERILALNSTSGKWEERQKGSENVAVLMVQPETGWSAQFDIEDFDRADRVVPIDPVQVLSKAFLLDVWLKAGGKVLSLRWIPSIQECKLISMRPGSWEAMFGLPPEADTPQANERVAPPAGR